MTGYVRLAVCLLLVPAAAGCLGSTGTPADAGGPQKGDRGSVDDLPGEHAPGEDSPLDRPHVHDRWDGQTRKVLMEDTVHIEKDRRFDRTGNAVNYANCEVDCKYQTTFTLPDGSIVPPGTERLEVTATWDADTGDNSDVTFGFQPADRDRFRMLDARHSPANWTVPTTVEMADGGHATLSLWRFRMVSCNCFAVTPPGQTGFAHDVDIRIVAHRVNGSLPLEPPHPDWWKDGPVREIYRDNGSAEMLETGILTTTLSGSLPIDFVNGSEHGLVPPGTTTLVAEFNWTSDGPASGQSSVQPYVEWNQEHTYPFHRWEPDRTEEGHYVYRMRVPEDRTDGMYADRSRWLFKWEIRGEDTGLDEPTIGQDITQPTYWEGSWNVRFLALNATGSGDVGV